jgi:hypothetical protein
MKSELKVKSKKGKGAVYLFNRENLTFYLLLFTFSLSLVFPGCNWKIKPTYRDKKIASDIEQMCFKEYRLSVRAHREGNTLEAYLWRVGLLQPGRTEMMPEAADALERVLLCATRIALSTDARLQFVEVKMSDVLSGASVTLWRYVPDIRDSMYTRMAEEEYINRLVMEVKPGTGNVSILTPQWDPPLTMDEFLAKQVILRAKRSSPVSIVAHEDLSVPQTLVIVMDNWPAIEKEGDPEKVTGILEMSARAVLRGYHYPGFQNIIIQNSSGEAVRQARL